MTFRNKVLAGVIVALVVPAISSASPLQVVNPNPRRTPAAPPAEFYCLHKLAMDRGVSHIEASEIAARTLKADVGPALDADWSLRHKQAMDQGVSHIDASMVADRE
jgi:hypothetical protein